MKGRENKPHIGIFGRRNYGKSSLINALTGQDIAIVSEMAGTTTDPVKKSIEIFGIGPVILIDTAGIDDVGELGKKRVAKTDEVLRIIDLAVIVINKYLWEEPERKLLAQLQKTETPFVIINNKSDEWQENKPDVIDGYPVVSISAITGEGMQELIQKMVFHKQKEKHHKSIPNNNNFHYHINKLCHKERQAVLSKIQQLLEYIFGIYFSIFPHTFLLLCKF